MRTASLPQLGLVPFLLVTCAMACSWPWKDEENKTEQVCTALGNSGQGREMVNTNLFRTHQWAITLLIVAGLLLNLYVFGSSPWPSCPLLPGPLSSKLIEPFLSKSKRWKASSTAWFTDMFAQACWLLWANFEVQPAGRCVHCSTSTARSGCLLKSLNRVCTTLEPLSQNEFPARTTQVFDCYPCAAKVYLWLCCLRSCVPRKSRPGTMVIFFQIHISCSRMLMSTDRELQNDRAGMTFSRTVVRVLI